MGKKFNISKEEKQEILKKYGVIKESDKKISKKFINEQITVTVKPEQNTEDFMILAKQMGCFKGSYVESESPIDISNDGKRYFVVVTGKSGRKYWFYSDYTYVTKVDGKVVKETWACKALRDKINALPAKSTKDLGVTKKDDTSVIDKTVTGGDVKTVTVTDIKKDTPEPLTIQTAGDQLSDLARDIQSEVTLESCVKFLDNYFLAAIDGQNNPNINTYKELLNRCNNNHQDEWNRENKKKLKWLQGQNMPQIFGLPTKYTKIGKIDTDKGRRNWRIKSFSTY